MSDLGDLLAKHELLLIFVVVVGGVLLGRISIFGTRLGVAGVLFAGLGTAALVNDPQTALTITPIVRELGLVLFVYCIGITSGPGFFSAWKSQGLRINLVVLASLAVATVLTGIGADLLGLDGGYAAGLFSGALTNTPALGAAAERLAGTDLATHPWLGYSVAYPFGVFGAILAIRGYAIIRKKALAAEIANASSSGMRALVTSNFRVTRPELDGKAVGELRVRDVAGVMISRLARSHPDPKSPHDHEVIVPTKYTQLSLGDTVTAVGTAEAISAAEAYFGARSDARLELERDAVDMRRVLVSRRDLIGKRISELDIDHLFGAQITRIRRADVDFLPSPEMRLELGDRIRVVAPTAKLQDVSRYFGDSTRDLAQLDFVALAIGLCLGLLVALIPLPGPGGEMKLGLAGGTLVSALVLGRFGRTGPLIWSIPFEINTALRDFGLLLFLAGVGVSAGGALGKLPADKALSMFVFGAFLTTFTSAIGLLLLTRITKANPIHAMGAATGLQTQPATLATAYELSNRSEQTYVAYAVAFPVAMIAKIILAQVLVMWL
jgi:putative transport protein